MLIMFGNKPTGFGTAFGASTGKYRNVKKTQNIVENQ